MCDHHRSCGTDTGCGGPSLLYWIRRDPTDRAHVAFSQVHAKKAARMSQLSTKTTAERKCTHTAPGGTLHASATRPSHPPRRLRLQLQSHPSIRPAEQSTTIGWCEVPAWRPGARGARVWYRVKASQAQLRRPVTPPGAGPPPSRGHPGSPPPRARPVGASVPTRGADLASRPCSRPRPPGSHCALTVTRVPTARAARPRSPWEHRTPASGVLLVCQCVCVSSLQRSLVPPAPSASGPRAASCRSAGTGRSLG